MTKERAEIKDQLQPQRCARLLRAVADPERLRIIRCLMPGPCHVSEIADLLGLEVANVSHHLGVLRHAGIVQDEKQGRFVLYHLNPQSFQPATRDTSAHLEFGCCRLEIPEPDRA